MGCIKVGFASLMFANIGFAEMRLIEADNLGASHKGINGWMGTVCVDGYKFIVYHETMDQFFEERDGKSLPAKC